MSSSKRPISVTILACLYLAVGAGGFVVHFRELLSRQKELSAISRLANKMDDIA